MNRRMAYVCLQATREGQASHAHVHEIMNGLERRGWEVTLYEPAYASRTGSVSLVTKLREFAAVQRRFGAEADRFDLVYVRDHPAASPCCRAATRTGVPLVLEVNGPPHEVALAYGWTRPLVPVLRRLFADRVRRATAVITVTELLGKYVAGLGKGVDVHVIGNGADPDRFRPATPADPPYALFIGAFAVWQGIKTLLAAIDRPEWPAGLPLVFAGDGLERPKVEAAAARDERVRYLGPVPYADAPALLAGATVSLSPKSGVGDRARTGLSPLKLYESMSCGVPVIVTDLHGQSEPVAESRCGLIVPPDDPVALAAAVAEMVRQPEAARAMGQRGRAAVLERYSWDAAAGRTADVLRGVVNGD